MAERPAPSERPAPTPNRSNQRSAAAEALAIDYLNTWSAPNGLTLDSTLSFYGSVVNFHGRTIGARELLEEKRRFVRRWPERDYQPRLDSVDASCPAESRSCIVRSTFDFAAANPAQGRRSEGTGTLELIVNFEGGRPIIVAERSVVRARDRSAQRSVVREVGDE